MLPYPFFEDNMLVRRLLFTGWLGYFALAYLMGMYYTQIVMLAKRYRMAAIVLVLLSGVFLYIRLQLGYMEVHSRRLDLVPLVVSVVLFVVASGQSLPYVALISVISKYAFMIYLMYGEVLRFSTGWFVDHFENTLAVASTMNTHHLYRIDEAYFDDSIQSVDCWENKETRNKSLLFKL